jgi:hypothetical protein
MDRKVLGIYKGFAVVQGFAEQGSVLLKNANGQSPLSVSSLRSIRC